MQENKFGTRGRLMLAAGGLMLLLSLFVPIWRIDLDAPQYPEGLRLLIHAHKIGGDVEIINGLNHYIGMATLHTDNFIEFTLLPYLISGFALLFMLTAWNARKKQALALLIAFAVFGVVAMADFWRWEYNYGHNLDPNAAIIVPGMAYQPPLIGFKQLLNFGAYSIPDIGGWLFIGAGILSLIVVLQTQPMFQRNFKRNTAPLSLLVLGIAFISCTQNGPEPIKLNKDACDHCKMTIADGRFGSELITTKGRVYKFDDLSCLIGYDAANKTVPVQSYYIHDFTARSVLIEATSAFYVKSEKARSPMRGDIAAFAKKEDAERLAREWGAVVSSWKDVPTLLK